ncbi:HAD-IA family hydrolase [Mesorhizobium sp.]|uniref:HAD family hydrolase n=1 Tax=Mesorhizobium sp. TaxID=1871066 RepID=UPI00257DAE0D|nr:HAD-IA family hydrolase [Mesorhizobium sp.]
MSGSSSKPCTLPASQLASLHRHGFRKCTSRSARPGCCSFEHALFSSTMVSRGKPFPDLFLHAAGTMGFAPADCIVIEDSVAGTLAGIAAGMRVFSYYGDPHSDRDGLTEAGGILFDDMRELAGLVPIH